MEGMPGPMKLPAAVCTEEVPLRNDREHFYYQLALIRAFEERVLDLFGKGELFGTTHACIGQEANAVGVIASLQGRDVIVSNHRCHGHYLAYSGDAQGLMAELMGKRGGVCDGRGGSQHLCARNFYTNGVQGNMLPVAAGMAYAEKAKSSGAIVVVFMGDGTFGEGSVYETFNLISLWKLPLLVVVENNRYAQTTPLSQNFSGSFPGRAKAFALSCGEIDSTDVEEIFGRFTGLVDTVRKTCRPHVEIVHTYRLCAHSKGDDHRPQAELDAHWKMDPLRVLGGRMEDERRQQIERRAGEELRRAEDAARSMPWPSLVAGG
jgi:TPP-dependent pyruvate/acetoin dehydrogenase alpha subunit